MMFWEAMLLARDSEYIFDDGGETTYCTTERRLTVWAVSHYAERCVVALGLTRKLASTFGGHDNGRRWSKEDV